MPMFRFLAIVSPVDHAFPSHLWGGVGEGSLGLTYV
jgi:hypothetical protein